MKQVKRIHDISAQGASGEDLSADHHRPDPEVLEKKPDVNSLQHISFGFWRNLILVSDYPVRLQTSEKFQQSKRWQSFFGISGRLTSKSMATFRQSNHPRIFASTANPNPVINLFPVPDLKDNNGIFVHSEDYPVITHPQFSVTSKASFKGLAIF